MSLPTHQLCKQFTLAEIQQIKPLGNGLINDTFLIVTEDTDFVLQRINTHVFPKPELIMDNLKLLHPHIRQKKAGRLVIPQLIHSLDQQLYYKDKQNNYWRALEFIGNTVSKELIGNQNDAEQVGFALGHFHYLFSDISLDVFHDTLPGFHVTPKYFQHYQTVIRQGNLLDQSKDLQFCQNFIKAFQPQINVLEDAKYKGLLFDRIIHGDPKLNNFLFDKSSDNIISLVDLDTVKPGLLHYDIADCLRSCCHILESNSFDLDICEVILKGYFREVDTFFTEQDYVFLYPAIQLIPFELGLRFLTDYLAGNQYFKVEFPEQNLDRAVAQFRLCENIGEQEREIRQLIKKCRSMASAR